MAIEFVGSTTTSTSGSLSLTSLTGGIASAPAEGDIVFVAVSNFGFFDQDISVSGYTEVADVYGNSALYDTNLGVFYKVMGATPDTTVTISIFLDFTAVVYVLRGFNPSTIADVTATTASTTNTGIPNPPSITTASDDTLVIIFSGSVITASGWTAPSGFSNAVVESYSNSHTLVASKLISAPATEDPATWAITGGSDNSFYSSASVTFALRDAGAGILLLTEPGSFALSGQTASLETARVATAESGSFAVTGADVSLEFGRELVAEAGSFAFSGQSVTLAATYTFTAESGSFLLSGEDAAVAKGLGVVAEESSYSLSGSTSVLELFQGVPAEPGSFELTSIGAALLRNNDKTVIAFEGDYSLDGAAGMLTYSRGFAPCGCGAYAVDGQESGLLVTRLLTAEGGSFNFTGQSGGLIRSLRILSSSGSFTLTGDVAYPTIGVRVGSIRVWDGSEWRSKPVNIWNGSEWVLKPVKYWNGTSWVTTGN